MFCRAAPSNDSNGVSAKTGGHQAKPSPVVIVSGGVLLNLHVAVVCDPQPGPGSTTAGHRTAAQTPPGGSNENSSVLATINDGLLMTPHDTAGRPLEAGRWWRPLLI